MLLEESLLLEAYGEFDPIGVKNSHMGRSVIFSDYQVFNYQPYTF